MAWNARRDLLYRLLDAYERSVSFRKPAPWSRDVLLRLEAKSFPKEFAPDGRTRLENLLEAVKSLEHERVARIDRHERGPLREEPRGLRCGPGEVAALEAASASEDLP